MGQHPISPPNHQEQSGGQAGHNPSKLSSPIFLTYLGQDGWVSDASTIDERSTVRSLGTNQNSKIPAPHNEPQPTRDRSWSDPMDALEPIPDGLRWDSERELYPDDEIPY